MQEVVIVAARRTAIGNFSGSLAKVSAPDLGAVVVRAMLEETGIEGKDVSEVIMGQVLTAGVGQGPARQTMIKAGLPVSVPAMTINQMCGSGLKTVNLGAQAIANGDAEIVIAGGQENMSLSPHLLPNARTGFRMGTAELLDSMLRDGLLDAFQGYHMGVTAENIARKYDIGREEQDAFALASQQKALAAQSEGHFLKEIVPVSVPQGRDKFIQFDQDEYIRRDASAEMLAKLRPAFDKEGSVTAGNASGLNDGAAAVILMSADKARRLGLQPLAVIRGYASAGVEPELMGMGPVPATRMALQRAGWSVHDLDLIEANEAFAVQSLGVGRELEWDQHKVNVNGGAIALGHPIGASGARILVTLLHEMQRRKAHKGLATLCIGGGMGVALAVERA